MFHKLFRFSQIAALATLLYCATPVSSAHAELLAYEGFNYAPGSLGGLNGGTGWSGAWVGGGGSSIVVEGGLTYTDGNGDQLLVTGNHVFSSGASGNADPSRFLSTVRNVGGTTTWLSFIAQRQQPHGTDAENLNRAATLQVRLDGSERLAVGKPTTSTGETNWAMWHTATASSADYTDTHHFEKAFLVVRIDHLGSPTDPDNAWLWVDPLLATEPNTANADASLIAGINNNQHFSFNRILGFIGNNQGANPYAELIYDEIRVGTTYTSVAPIFDPNVLPSDFNGDGVVDLLDFDILRQNFLTGTTQAQGDANFDGVVDHQDFFLWRTDYLAAGGSLSDFTFAVPEPSTGIAALMMAVCAGNLFGRSRSRR